MSKRKYGGLDILIIVLSCAAVALSAAGLVLEIMYCEEEEDHE